MNQITDYVFLYLTVLSDLGEKMTEEECEMVFQGHEDAQGNVNYEGKIHIHFHQSYYSTSL